ncbi:MULTISPECIES: aspartyl-phosphate phosphatase Spo0E family protein [Paenibacillus]|uniref:aspartyl-phosphate phosphatase Spo0E family protein n=1 Tax=Paenibacillus TaxID=44249 RepID=UPI0022B8FB38|nr:aspartyl-phosphate phosphatase Spo0E family protein [Paenibacillus caseinilyticus]MCZ8521534.1 aspartyl-phosphate phosphatase Spo0E family protein [Paenibacillus caseinilyticus]
MEVKPQLERQIQSCIEDLEDMVTGSGCALTDPDVVRKSMELDELILVAMRSQRAHAKKVH